MQEINQATKLPGEAEELVRVADAALTWCNKVLVEHDGTMQTELAPGIPKDPCRCSLAMTLKAGLDEERWVVIRHEEATVEGRAVEHSPESAEYSAFFDARLYPDLVIE